MNSRQRLIAFVAVAALLVAGIALWPKAQAAPLERPLVGDPALADMAITNAAVVRASGKYAFFIVERQNSSHRWFMRFDTETGTLARLTPDAGWTVVSTTADLR